MSVTFKIISYQRLTPGQQETFNTDLQKFSIGRRPENDWALPDPQRFMSGTHCWIENRGGTWFVIDTSTNGVFVNGSDQRMTKNDAQALNVGDKIRIGDYELELVQQDSADSDADALPDPFADDDDFFGQEATSIAQTPMEDASGDMKDVNTPLSQMDSSLLGSSVSIDDIYDLDEEEEAPEPPPSLASRSSEFSPLDNHFSAPKVETPPPSPAGTDPMSKYSASLDDIPDNWDDIPDNWDEDIEEEEELAPPPAASPPPPPPAATPEPPPAAVPEYQSPPEPAAPPTAAAPPPDAPARFHAEGAVEAFATGAGLDPDLLKIDDEAAFFNELGALLRTMTHGLMQAIAARGQVKSEFRLEQTMIAPTENNPFKFSVSEQEALMRLLKHTDGAYLSGTEAAKEAVDDINAHQLAVMAGTEAALKSILRRFNPDKLVERFGGGSGSMSVLKKAKYWDFYKARYLEITEAVDDDFQHFFGAEFSDAYEEQLDRLKLSRED